MHGLQKHEMPSFYSGDLAVGTTRSETHMLPSPYSSIFNITCMLRNTNRFNILCCTPILLRKGAFSLEAWHI